MAASPGNRSPRGSVVETQHAAPASRFLVGAIIASQLGGPFMFGGVAVALPDLGRDIGASATALGLVESLFLAGSAAFLLPLGRLADAADKRAVYKIGLLTFGLTSIAIAASSTTAPLLALRFLQGVSSSLVAATAPALLAEIVPASKRGRAYGLSIGTVYVGLTIGPVVAGFLIEQWGWRSVFISGGGVILTGLLLVHGLLPATWRRPERGAVHLPSAALVTAAVLLLVFGAALVRHGALGYASLAAGAVLGAAFLVVQRRVARPLLDVTALLENAVLRNALGTQLLLYLSATAMTFLLSLFMQVSLGHPATIAGRVLAVGSLVMALIAPVAGALSDRIRPGWVSLVGVTFVLLSASLAALRGASLTLPWVVVVLALQGIGYGLFSSPNMSLIMGSVPLAQTSTASSLAALARSLGMVSGMIVVGLLFSLYFEGAAVSERPDLLSVVAPIAFWTLTVTGSLALVVSALSRRHRG